MRVGDAVTGLRVSQSRPPPVRHLEIGHVDTRRRVRGDTTVSLASSAAELLVDGLAILPGGETSGRFGLQWLPGDDDSVASISATLGVPTVWTEVSFTG